MQDAAVEILRRLIEVLVAALNQLDDVPDHVSASFVYNGTGVRLFVQFDAGKRDAPGDLLHLLALPHHAPLMVFSEQ